MATPYVTDESGKDMYACTFVLNIILSGNPATIIKVTFIFFKSPRVYVNFNVSNVNDVVGVAALCYS